MPSGPPPPPALGDEARLALVRHVARRMVYSALAVAVIGVLVMFLPSTGDPHFMQIIGALTIVCAAVILGWAGYLRRRLQ